jgi:hypothetical protein
MSLAQLIFLPSVFFVLAAPRLVPAIGGARISIWGLRVRNFCHFILSKSDFEYGHEQIVLLTWSFPSFDASLSLD